MVRGPPRVCVTAPVVPFPRFVISGVRDARVVRPRCDSGRPRGPEQDPGDRQSGEHDDGSAETGTARAIEPGWERPDPDLQVTSGEIVGPSSVRLVIEM